MEQSAFEALMIGVYVFIFIAALTAGVLLMSNVIDMVNYANKQAVVGMNGTLAETVGVVEERLYTGTQLLTYYKEEIEDEALEKTPKNYSFTVKLSEGDSPKTLNRFIAETYVTNYLNEKFVLKYKGQEEGIYNYEFVKYVEEEEE